MYIYYYALAANGGYFFIFANLIIELFIWVLFSFLPINDFFLNLVYDLNLFLVNFYGIFLIFFLLYVKYKRKSKK